MPAWCRCFLASLIFCHPIPLGQGLAQNGKHSIAEGHAQSGKRGKLAASISSIGLPLLSQKDIAAADIKAMGPRQRKGAGDLKLEGSEFGLAPQPQAVDSPEDAPSSFPLEFRATALCFVLLEAACLFLSSKPNHEGQVEHSEPATQTRLQPLALQPIRFLGIALIVLYHEFGELQWADGPGTIRHFFLMGDVWVQFFFALSGFVLYLSQKDAPQVRSSAGFIAKRVVNMYPSYLISTLMGIAVAKEPRKVFSLYVDGHVLPGFLMIDTWASPYLYGANMPAWFVCSLFFNWLCFPRWYRLIRSFGSPWKALLLAWLSSFALPLVHTLRWLHLTWDEPGGGSPPTFFTMYHPLGNWQQFVFGMCLARIATEARLDNLPLYVRQLAASTALVTVLVMCFLVPYPPNNFLTADIHSAPNPFKLFWHKGPLLLPLFALVLVFVPAGQDLMLHPRYLQSQCALWLGSVSANLYMFSYPVRMMVRNWMVSYVPSSVLCPLSLITQFIVAVVFGMLQSKLMGSIAQWSQRCGWKLPWSQEKSGTDLEYSVKQGEAL